jgi:DNA-binding NtrC family response regulator
VPLAAGDRKTVGRAEEADVVLKDLSVSRLHAELSVEIAEEGTASERVSVFIQEKEGSTNGTFVGGNRLSGSARVAIDLGNTFQIGQTLLMVDYESRLPRPRRLFPHGYFAARIEEECLRQQDRREKHEFVVARLSIDAEGDDRFLQACVGVLGPTDILARQRAGQYELMLLETGLTQAEATVAALGKELRAAGIVVRHGLALFPRDAQSAFALMDAANVRLEPRPGHAENAATPVQDPAMAALMQKLERAATTSSTVLLTGETGTGKSFLAERLHRMSARSAGPFISCDCGAISRDLIESELFGHAKGAFTGAWSAKTGVIEAAHGGTLFLDEVAELPVEQQVKLLTVLDKKGVRRVGEVQGRAVDFRLVAATNRDLRKLVREGRFREELFFRLNVIRLHVPPLRQRPSDVVLFAQHFLKELVPGASPPPALVPETLAYLSGYPWPGNIRELRHALERAVGLSDGGVLLPDDFELDEPGDEPVAEALPAGGDPSPATITRDQLMALLIANGCNRTRAAKALGRSREWLRGKCQELGIPLGR